MRTRDRRLLELSRYGGVVSSILKYLLENNIVDLVIGIRRGNVLSAEPVFITNAEDVVETAGAFSITPVNMAKLLRDYVKPSERVALTVKPCEAKAVEHLVRRGLFKRENLVLIGLNCGGLFDPFSLKKKLVEMNVDPGRLVDIRYLRDSIKLVLEDGGEVEVDYVEGLSNLGYRDACKRCMSPIPENTDIACGYWGLVSGYEKYTYTIPFTRTGAEILDSMVEKGLLEVIEAPREGVELRDKLIDVVKKSAELFRQKQFKDLDTLGVEKILTKCIMCLECWHACPIRSEKEVLVWNKKVKPVLWQISVITYMYDKCVECGSCDDVCPMKIPFSLIIQRIRTLRRELGV